MADRSMDELFNETLADLKREMEQAGGKVAKPKPSTPEEDFIAIPDADTPVPDVPLYSELLAEYGGAEYIKETKYPDFPVTHYFKTEDWNESLQAAIPDESGYKGTFIVDHTVLYPMLSAMCRNMKVMTYGPTGSGKTELVKFMCSLVHQPYLRINGRRDMETDALLGKPWVSEGSMHFDLGAMPQAMLDGMLIAFDEPWKTPTGIQMALQRYYERNGELFLDDMPGTIAEKTITPDPRSRMVLCDNVVGTGDNLDAYAATEVQDTSTLNRIDRVLKQDYLKPDQELELIKSQFAYIPEKKAKQMVQLANLIRSGNNEGVLSLGFSPRNYIAWAESAKDAESYEVGFCWTMLERFNRDDDEREAIKGMWNQVFGTNI